ncbi:uncharacterized mitochondrial protein-like protein [Tanacetum coccineum]
MLVAKGGTYKEGIEFLRNSSSLTTSQGKRVIDLFHQANVLNAKPAITPLDPTIYLHNVDGNPLSLQEASTNNTLVGKLVYLTIARPDISFAAQLLSQFSQQQRTPHIKALLWFLNYIKLYLIQGLHFPLKNSLKLLAYCDSDWASSRLLARLLNFNETSGGI